MQRGWQRRYLKQESGTLGRGTTESGTTESAPALALLGIVQAALGVAQREARLTPLTHLFPRISPHTCHASHFRLSACLTSLTLPPSLPTHVTRSHIFSMHQPHVSHTPIFSPILIFSLMYHLVPFFSHRDTQATSRGGCASASSFGARRLAKSAAFFADELRALGSGGSILGRRYGEILRSLLREQIRDLFEAPKHPYPPPLALPPLPYPPCPTPPCPTPPCPNPPCPTPPPVPPCQD